MGSKQLDLILENDILTSSFNDKKMFLKFRFSEKAT